MQGTEIDNSPIDSFPITKKISLQALKKERKPVVLEKYDFENRKRLKLTCLLWNFWTTRILMGEKNDDFLVKSSSTSAVSSIEILLEEIERVVAEKKTFEYRTKS